MFALILLIVIGFGMAAFATQNVEAVSINLIGNTLTEIPLYTIVLGSMLLGILISYLISLVNSINSILTIHNKETTINAANKKIEALQETNHSLELDLAQLKNEHNISPISDEAKPSLKQRFKQAFS